MRKRINRVIALVATLALTGAAFVGCSSTSNTNTTTKATDASSTAATSADAKETTAADNTEVTVLKVHVSQGPAPYLYVDDNGNPDGFDFAVFKEAINRLPQYEAEYISASDGLTGVLSGLYDVTVGNWVWRTERGESYYYSYPYKVTDKAFVQREGDEPLTSLQDAADRGYTVITGASGGDTAALEKWNETHPDAQIKIIYTEADVIVRYQQVAEGAADFTMDDGPMISAYFDQYEFEGITKVTLSEEALTDILQTVNTYYLYAKDERGQKIRDDINVAIKEIYEDGTLDKLSEQYFGYKTTPAAADFETTIN